MITLMLALRVVLIYGYLLLLVRLAGRRGLKQTTALDLLVALLLSSLTTSFAMGEVSAASTVAATGVLLGMHLGVSQACQRSSRLARLFGPVSGRP